MLIDLTSLTMEELESLRVEIETEKFSRKDAERQKLIEDFKKAFKALEKAGYTVYFSILDYSREELCEMDEIPCDYWENFSFY